MQEIRERGPVIEKRWQAGLDHHRENTNLPHMNVFVGSTHSKIAPAEGDTTPEIVTEQSPSVSNHRHAPNYC